MRGKNRGQAKGEAMRILVATDGSRGSAAALIFAARLAARDAGSELIVLSVESPNGRGPAGPIPDGAKRGKGAGRVQSHAQKILQIAARELNHKGAEARFQLIPARRYDEVPEAISREADRLKADLVVVGSEGRDTLNEWVLGGTALRLIYVARRPVTVVRPRRRRKAS
jgi:nucleotide-binding universal stress UspA family protein